MKSTKNDCGRGRDGPTNKTVVLDSEDSDSSMSSVVVASPASVASKRRLEAFSPSSEEEGEKVARVTRGNASSRASLARGKSKKDVNRSRREHLRLKAEKELMEETVALSRSSSHISLEEKGCLRLGLGSDAALPVVDLLKEVRKNVTYVQMVGSKSSNLKGEFAGGLKKASAAILDAVCVLGSRTASEETKVLQTANSRLQEEVAALRRDVESLKKALEEARRLPVPPPPPAPPAPLNIEELSRTIMAQVGTMINARLEVMAMRLPPEPRIRPSLAADSPANDAATIPSDTGSQRRSKRTPTMAARRVPDAEQVDPAPSTSAGGNTEGWNIVARKRSSKERNRAQPVSRPPRRQAQKNPASKRALRPERSAAVTLTLQPAAVERQVTYADMIKSAKQKVDLVALGITRLRFRTSATGARVLEIPGAASGAKADSLAEKLREKLESNLVKVSRPIKSAELRLLGLDESVDNADVVAAVAREGECPADSVTCGTVKRGADACRGTAWVRCPASAARKLVSKGHLQVGWVSARVVHLLKRPLRCYRCKELGHTRALCASQVDRSEECHRCGNTGHLANSCTSKPRCTVCEAAGKPSGHRCGSNACTRITPKKKMKLARSGQPANDSPSGAEVQTETGGNMDTN